MLLRLTLILGLTAGSTREVQAGRASDVAPAPTVIANAASAGVEAATATVVTFAEPAYGPLQTLLDDEARAAMNAGRYLRCLLYTSPSPRD